MRGPIRALIWELWRLSRWEFLLRTLVMSTAGCLVFYLVGAQASAAGVTHGLAIPMVAMAAMMSLFSGIWINVFDSRATGFCFYLGFARPINTPLLVGVPMIYISFLTGLTYLIPAMLMRRFCEVFPVFSVTALLVTICATLVMAVWSGWSLASRGAFFSGIMIAWGAVALTWGIRHRESIDPLTATPELLSNFFSFSPFHYAGMLLIHLCALIVTIFMVERQRHGDTLPITHHVAALLRRDDRISHPAPPFRGPYHAQFWLEMRRSGIPLLWVGLAGAAAMLLFFTLLGVFANITRLVVDASKSLAILWLVVIALSPSVYMLIGTEWLLGLTRRQGAVSLSTFESTQPIKNTAFLSIKFFVLSLSVLAGLVLMIAAGGIWFSLFGDLGDWVHVAASIRAAWNALALHPALLTLIALYAGAISYVTCSALVYIGGIWLGLRPWLFFIAYVVGSAYLAVACFGRSLHWELGPFWEIHAWLLSAFLVALAITTLRLCVKRGYLKRMSLTTILCVWSAYFAILAIGLTKLTVFGLVPPLFLNVLAFSSLTMPLTAVTAAPLSLGAFRHR